MLQNGHSITNADSQCAPPLPPSPITTQTIGVSSRDISYMLSAITHAWPRSSAPIPG
jgi:hypothetical protein